MKKALALLLAFAVVAPSAARAADILAPLFQRVEQTRWGSPPPATAQPIMKTMQPGGKITVEPMSLSGTDGTLNHLFSTDGRLYNVSWHTVIPVAEMDRARALFAEIVGGLTAKYRAPRVSHREGDPAKAAEVANPSPELRAAREKVAALMEDGAAKPNPAALKEALGGFQIFDVMPVLFYDEEFFWDSRPLRAYAALFCSTDGTCYVHVNFISKRQAGREPYPDGERKPFSYTPLDRDQDGITAANKSLF